MAFTTPSTWVDGVAVTAADLNAQIRDNIRYLKGLDGVTYLENVIELLEMAAPTTPASGRGRLFIDTSNYPSVIDDGGLIRKMMRFTVAGAYTPVYSGVTTPGTTTYTAQVGRYAIMEDIGLAFFTAWVLWTNATGTGDAQVSLPFTSANISNLRQTFAVRSSSVTFANSGVQALILPNTSQVAFSSPISNTTATAIAVETAGDLLVTGWCAI